MYLISLYFDEKTNNIIRKHMKQVASKSDNDYMISGNVPPHITVAGFSIEKSKENIDENLNELTIILEKRLKSISKGKITWAGVGTFLPSVIYLAPVLNEYIDEVSKVVYNSLCECKNELSCKGIRLEINSKYIPYNWIPHTTIGKNLSSVEMKTAFEVMQGRFGVFTGEVVKIGIARTNPYEDVVVFDDLATECS